MLSSMKLKRSQLQTSLILAIFMYLWRWYSDSNKKSRAIEKISELEESLRNLRQENRKLRSDIAKKDVELVTTKINLETMKNSASEAKEKCNKLVVDLEEARERAKYWENQAKMNSMSGETSPPVTIPGSSSEPPSKSAGVTESLPSVQEIESAKCLKDIVKIEVNDADQERPAVASETVVYETIENANKIEPEKSLKDIDENESNDANQELAAVPSATVVCETIENSSKTADPVLNIPKLNAINPKSQAGVPSKGEQQLQKNLVAEIEKLKMDLQSMRNKHAESEAIYKAEMEAANKSNDQVVLRYKIENEKLQKELKALRINKEADKKDLIALTKALEDSLIHQNGIGKAKYLELLKKEVNISSSKVSNVELEAAKALEARNSQLEELSRSKEVDLTKLQSVNKELQVKVVELTTELKASKDLANCYEESLERATKEEEKHKIAIAEVKADLERVQQKLKEQEQMHKVQLAKAIEGKENEVSKVEEQEEKHKIAIAELKADLERVQQKLKEQEQMHQVQLAKTIDSNEYEVSKVEEQQFPECKNFEGNAEDTSSLKSKLEESERIKGELMTKLEAEQQLRIGLEKQLEACNEKTEKLQLNLQEFVAVQQAVGLFQEKLVKQGKQYEANRIKLKDAYEQLEHYKKMCADCKKNENEATALLQLEVEKNAVCMNKLTELQKSFEEREKEQSASVDAEKKELREELQGYILKVIEYEQQLKEVWKLTDTETVLGLKSKIEKMKVDAKNNSCALQFITAERDCATEELEISKKNQSRDQILLIGFFLVVLCAFCLWGKLDTWNKIS